MTEELPAAPAGSEAAAPEVAVVKDEPVDEAGLSKRQRSPTPPTRQVKPRLAAAAAPKVEEGTLVVDAMDVAGPPTDVAGPSGSAPPAEEDEESESSGMEEEEDDEATLDQVCRAEVVACRAEVVVC